MTLPAWCDFLEQRLPSANAVLIRGPRPVLVDSGYGSDVERLWDQLDRRGVEPSRVSLVVNTHHHSDHVGGNASFQQAFGTPIAADRRDAQRINAGDPRACDADYLAQPVAQYRVDRPLDPGQELEAGPVTLEILSVPGHTPDSLAFWEPRSGVLLGGDVVHQNDLGWLDLARRGPAVIEVALDTIERLSHLPIRVIASGHGPLVTDPAESLRRARQRLMAWRSDPEKAHWHALKRIFAYALLMFDGLLREAIGPYLCSTAWHGAISRGGFSTEPGDFVEPLVAEMLRSGAAIWQGDLLCATAAYWPASAQWLAAAPMVDQWVRPDSTGAGKRA